MTVESSELMHATMPVDRRPAIWPWLVMPLIALTMFYYLDRLSRQVGDQEDAPVPAAHTDAPGDSGTL